jgi:hypothetical protein
MRQVLTFLTIITFCSCGQKSEQTKTTQDSLSVNNINILDTQKTTKKVENKTMELTMLEWEKQEDSLRNVILGKKENKVLKESFLREMYIRNIVNVSRDSLFVTIPFNLHGPDCGAPDCYTTDISFSFKLDDTLIFPKNIQFREYEHGCVDKEIKLSGSFQLVEETEKHIIYYSTKHKRTLVLFSSNKENGTTAFYFTGVGLNRINGQNVYTIMNDYKEDKDSIYPFTSWVLTTSEYENFLK